ncbi:MAG: hypothetical protein ACYCS8_00485 [Acidithiobacillus sp.]
MHLVDPGIHDDAESYGWHPDTVAACPEFDIHLPRICYQDMVNAVGIIPNRQQKAPRISDAWCHSNVWRYHNQEFGGLGQVFASIVHIFSDHLLMRMHGERGIHDLLGSAGYRGNGRSGLSGKIWFVMDAVKNILPSLHPVAAQDVHLKLKLSHTTSCWSGESDGIRGYMDFSNEAINAASLVAWCDLAERLSLHQAFDGGFSLPELVVNECNRLYDEHLENQQKARLDIRQNQDEEEQKRQEQAALQSARMESVAGPPAKTRPVDNVKERQPKNSAETPSSEWVHTCCDDDKITAEMAWGTEKEDSVVPVDVYYHAILAKIARMRTHRRY